MSAPASYAVAASTPDSVYGVGDVFLSVSGSAFVKERAPVGRPVRKIGPMSYAGPLDTVFDAGGVLLVATFSGVIDRFDPQGQFAGVFADTATDGLGGYPGSMSLDAAGHVFVGAQSRNINNDQANVIREYDSNGVLIDHFTVASSDHSVANIDVSSDQCTIHYTTDRGSGVPPAVLAYNVCTRTQEAPVTTSLPGAFASALREIPDSGGQILVAEDNDVALISATGAVLRTYKPATFSDSFDKLSLDPDGTSFWTDDSLQGEIYRIRISDGKVLRRFHVDSTASGTGDKSIFGLSVFGERTAGRSS